MIKNPLLQKLITQYQMLKFRVNLTFDYYYDLQRFFKLSATNNPYTTKTMLQGRIIAHYHVIEKGLSLKNPRPGFGANVVHNLLLLLKHYQENYGLDEVTEVAINVLYSYYKFNLSYNCNHEQLYQKIIQIKDEKSVNNEYLSEGGTIEIKKAHIHKSALINFQDFVNSRHSIRNFANGDVDIKLIKEAVSIAIKTPSVCNRQTWKVHVYSHEEIKNKILSHQNGNRGFGEYADKVLIITSDLNYFTGSSERNQCFVDGGLFAMSLIYALHSLGLGSCCLNWCVSHQTDKLLRKDAGIKESETVIMMLAVGNLPDELSVANSARKAVEEVLVLND
ncbi:nitroreductase family protein [Anabaena sp. CS-542/02]|uniref:nitroreductase family protein n=1 Tax=Anabaena sp. CS-542/02 TaxID=3021719 RepID=UPI00232E5037|nr:nitroreductase family protein [Anabaena sp. CS-542/02]MDB9445941.1 nitroreductase family protein [Anabaena sp. CS-542/02]